MTKEEVIQYIKDWNLDNNKMEILSVIIPELKESEDEMIRKELLDYLDSRRIVETLTDTKVKEEWIAWFKKQGEQTTDKIIERARTEKQRVLLTETNGNAHIDWNCRNLQDVKLLLKYGLEYIDAQLEKQAEQKPADKVEPKFKVGDKILEKDFDECGCGTIIDIKDGKYIFDDGSFICIKEQGLWKLVEQKPADKPKPKFKDGDIIKHNKANIIYKVISVNSGSYYVENINTGGRIELSNAEQNFHPWTIQDAKDGDVLVDNYGNILIYEGISSHAFYHSHCFGNENLFIEQGGSHMIECTHPATQEQRDLLFQKMKEAGYEWDAEKKELKKIEHKSAWSDEDEVMLGNALYACKEKYCSIETYNWLKSLKERMQPQNNTKLKCYD